MPKHADRSRTKQLHQYFVDEVTANLQKSGYTVEPAALGGDLFAVKPADKGLLIGINVVRDARKTEIEEKLSAATVRLLQMAARQPGLGGRQVAAVALVGAPSVTETLWQSIQAFGEEWLSPLGRQIGVQLAYGLIDTAGTSRIAVSGGELPVFHLSPAPGLDPIKPAKRKVVEVFSDLGQWQLKVLLGQRLPHSLINIPARTLDASRPPLKTAADLAKAAAVSRANSYKLVTALKEEHFLRDVAGLQLVRVFDLLRRWAPYGSKYTGSVDAVPIMAHELTDGDLDRLVRRYVEQQRGLGLPALQNTVALAGAAAADRLGVGHRQGVTPALYSRFINDDVLRQLQLRPAKPGERPQLLLRQPKYPEAVFRSVVLCQDVPVTDILQTWMDVQNDARGQEQADVIMNLVLAKHLQKENEWAP